MNKLQMTFASLVCFVLLLGNALESSATQLLTNGGFETGDFSGWTQFEPSAGQQTIDTSNPFEGASAVRINNTQPASDSFIQQAGLGVGTVTPGQSIDISFAARGFTDVGGVAFGRFRSLNSSGGTTKIDFFGPLALDPDPNQWTVFNFTTTAASDVSGGVSLELAAVTGGATGSTADIFFDAASVSVIPEPASFVLLGLTGIALVGSRRKWSN